MSLFRKILLSLMVIGGIASLVSAGTYASFNATATNGSSTFATGSLVLDRKVGATSCFSVGAGSDTTANHNASCGAVANLTRVKLADSNSFNLTTTSAGSLGGTLTLNALDADAGTAGNQACLNAPNTGSSFTTGTGDLCAATDVVIQETDSTFAVPTGACAYPVGASACNITTSPGSITGLNTSSSPLALGALAPSTPRYFKITFLLPNDGSVTDQFQGRRSTFQLRWNLA